jgi:hypothetical protein
VTGISAYENKREQARTARYQAKDLRELNTISRCGLDIRINYGTKHVPHHIALRISDQFPIWADEYEAIADRLEAEMQSMFSPEPREES